MRLHVDRFRPRAAGRAALWLLAAGLLGSAIAAEAGPQAQAGRTTASPVYSEPQAERGANTFASRCTGCHTSSSFSGGSFMTTWKGATLFELLDFLTTSMPEDAPGSLTPQEYVQVIAFILQQNRMPAGDTDLPADPDALKTIRLEPASPRP